VEWKGGAENAPAFSLASNFITGLSPLMVMLL